MKSYMKKVLAGALVLGMAGSVSAATTVYDNDKPGWLDAVDNAYVTEAFEDDTFNPGVSVVSDNGEVDMIKEVWSDLVRCESVGGASTTWKFEKPIASFGGNWDLDNVGVAATGIIAVVVDGVPVEVGEIPPTHGGEFWGFVSDVAFTEVLLKAGSGCDGDYYTGELFYLDDMVYSDPTVSLDVHPGGCPNPLNKKSKGITPMAILGTADFDVIDVNVSSLTVNGVSPVRSVLEDVGTPYEGESSDPADKYECNEDGPDTIMDLTLNFDTQAILDGVDKGEQYMEITGEKNDGTPITGKDVVWVK